MTSLFPRISLLLTGILLSIVLVMLTVNRVDYCGRSAFSQKHINDGRSPTLAPVQKVVFLQVESDSADLEVSFIGN